MAEKIEVVNEKNITEKVTGYGNKIVELGRDGLYMGLGIVCVIQDNVEALIKKGKDYQHDLVERGEKLADENRGKVTELVEKPQTVAKDTYKKATDAFDKYSEEVLTRAHIPTADVIDTMTKKVNAVDKKLDKLIKETHAQEKI